MKDYIYIILFPLLISCSLTGHLPKDVLREKDALGQIKAVEYYAAYFDPNLDVRKWEKTYYIVKPEMLKKARELKTLAYVGSTNNYHLFRIWSKLAYHEDEICRFAIEKKYCEIEKERTIKDESMQPKHRNIMSGKLIITNGKCIVKE